MNEESVRRVLSTLDTMVKIYSTKRYQSKKMLIAYLHAYELLRDALSDEKTKTCFDCGNEYEAAGDSELCFDCLEAMEGKE